MRVRPYPTSQKRTRNASAGFVGLRVATRRSADAAKAPKGVSQPALLPPPANVLPTRCGCCLPRPAG